MLFARPALAAVRGIHAVRRRIQRRAGKIGWARDLAALHSRPGLVTEPAPLALRERPGKDYGPWTQCSVGKASSCTVTGLASGAQYWFQVCAIGAAGPSAWSDPATKRAT